MLCHLFKRKNWRLKYYMLLLPSFQYIWRLIKPITMPHPWLCSGSIQFSYCYGGEISFRVNWCSQTGSFTCWIWMVFTAESKIALKGSVGFSRPHISMPHFMNNSWNYPRLLSIGKQHLLEYFMCVVFSQLLHTSIDFPSKFLPFCKKKKFVTSIKV